MREQLGCSAAYGKHSFGSGTGFVFRQTTWHSDFKEAVFLLWDIFQKRRWFPWLWSRSVECKRGILRLRSHRICDKKKTTTQHIAFSFSEIPHGTAVTVVDASSNDFCRRLVEPGSTFWLPQSASCCGCQSHVSAIWHQRNTINYRTMRPNYVRPSCQNCCERSPTELTCQWEGGASSTRWPLTDTNKQTV